MLVAYMLLPRDNMQNRKIEDVEALEDFVSRMCIAGRSRGFIYRSCLRKGWTYPTIRRCYHKFSAESRAVAAEKENAKLKDKLKRAREVMEALPE